MVNHWFINLKSKIEIHFNDLEVYTVFLELCQKFRLLKNILKINDKFEPYHVIMYTSFSKKELAKILDRYIKNLYYMR